MKRSKFLWALALLPLTCLNLLHAQQERGGASQDPDSLYLKRFVREVKIANVDSDKADKMSDSQLDKELKEYSSAVRPVGFMKSPDGKFTVYQVEVENCGAYCNSEWFSRIVNSGPDSTVRTLGLFPLTRIHLLPDGKYLLLQHGSVRPAGFYVQEILAAEAIEWDNGELDMMEYFQSHWEGHLRSRASLVLGQETGVNVEMELYYDEKDQTLRYHYGYALDIYNTEDAIEEEAVFEYKDGFFIEVERRQKLIKLGEY